MPPHGGLEDVIREHLTEELGDATVAEGLADVVSIEPDGDNYLSTAGVAEKAVQAAGAGGLGQVGVVGYFDHAKRCVDTSIAAGTTGAAVPAEAELPVDYDPESGQEWTRSRTTYLLHGISARLGSA